MRVDRNSVLVPVAPPSAGFTVFLLEVRYADDQQNARAGMGGLVSDLTAQGMLLRSKHGVWSRVINRTR